MQKSCKCGHMMDMRLRTVIYLNKVEINNVPIYSCDVCSYSEIFAEVKPDLTGLLGKLGKLPEERQLSLDELNEFAHLMTRMINKEYGSDTVEKIIEERINELLDLLLLAKSIDNLPWIEDIQNRLAQICKHPMST